MTSWLGPPRAALAVLAHSEGHDVAELPTVEAAVGRVVDRVGATPVKGTSTTDRSFRADFGKFVVPV
jgi:hypothetical protein